MNIRRQFGIVCLLVTVALPLAAQQGELTPSAPVREGRAWVQEYHCAIPTKPGRTLRVRSDVGAVRVRPTEEGQVTCRVRVRVYTRNEAEAHKRLQRFSITAQPVKDGVLLTGRVERSTRNRRSYSLNVEFEVHVPRRYNVNLQTQGGEIEVGKLDGEVHGVTAGGNISVEDVTGKVEVETAGGSIYLGNVGNRLRARTAGGSIQVGDVHGDARLLTSGGSIIGGRIEGAVKAQTAGGDILLRGATGQVEAETAGGQIRIGESGGSVQAQTAGGSVLVYGARGLVDVRTAGGSIDLYDLNGAVRAVTAAGSILALIQASQKNFAASELETSHGDVKVYLPMNLALTIEAVIDNSRGHRIHSDFPLQTQEENQRVVLRTIRAFGPVNGGGKLLRIRTTNGNIMILKLTEAVQQQLQRQKEQMNRRFEQQWQRLQKRLQRQRERMLQQRQQRQEKREKKFQ